MTNTKAFSKYQDYGSYHWSATQEQGIKGYDPRLHARYRIAANLIHEHLGEMKGIGLDIGCGDGVMIQELMKRGHPVIGLDTEEQGILMANKNTGKQNILASAYQLPVNDNTCDFVVSIEVIEHLSLVKQYANEIARVLKPNGIAVITTPHCLQSGDLQDPFHITEYDAKSLHNILEESFTNTKVIGFHPEKIDRYYIAPTKSRLLNKSTKLFLKLFFRHLYNPYQHVTTATPDYQWKNLLAVCYA